MTSRDLALAAVHATDEYQASKLRDLASAEYARESHRSCTDCDLASTRVQVAPWTGWPAPILLVLDAPNREEEFAGELGLGQEGKLLRLLARDAGLIQSGSTPAIANQPQYPFQPRFSLASIIGCRPPNSKYDLAVKADAPARCRVHLDRAIDASQAWVVVAIGNKAAIALNAPMRGTWIWRDGRLLSSASHPYTMRGASQDSQDARRETLATLRRAALIAAMEAHLPPHVGFPHLAHLGVQLPKTAKRRKPGSHRIVNERDAFERHWKRYGWVAVHSPVLDDKVVVVNRSIRRGVSVPPEYNGYAQYSPEELARMRGNREGLRRVHAAKLVFGGELVV